MVPQSSSTRAEGVQVATVLPQQRVWIGEEAVGDIGQRDVLARAVDALEPVEGTVRHPNLQ